MSDHLTETRLSSERIFTGRAVKLDVDRVRLPDGTESVREVIRHPGAVVIVGLLADQRVVMIRQHRYCVGQELLELPAGTLEAGEDPAECARRELAEETGYQSDDWTKITSFYTTPGFTDELIHCYLAKNLQPGGVGEMDEDERIETVTMPLSSAQTMARRGELHDAKTMVALLLCRHDRL